VPLFESVLVFENYPLPTGNPEAAAEAGLRLHAVRSIEQTNYPLTLYAIPGTRFCVKALYDRRRFEPAAIQRLLGHLHTLLAEMVVSAGRPLASLSLLTPQERQQLQQWNATQTVYPRETLARLFEQAIARHPDAIVLSSGESSVSGEELNARANQLARVLRARGVGPDRLVGLCLSRSVELVVGLLAILKAGGAYLPLDPSYPQERLDLMLSDAGCDLLLTQQRWRTRVPQGPRQVLVLEEIWPLLAGQASSNLEEQATAENLAYVIYTSGSTGRPKGVMVTQ